MSQAWHMDIFQSDLARQQGQAPLNTGPIRRLTDVERTLELNAPNSYTLGFILTDPLLANITHGNYVELKRGDCPDDQKKLWITGYVEDVQKAHGGGDELSVQLSSALLALADIRNAGDLTMTYGEGYHSIIDVLNGINPPGQPATPLTKGVLSGTGWRAVWTGKGGPPGILENWRTDWQTPLANLLWAAQHYGFFFRERPGSMAHSGVLEIGPLSDDSGFVAYGGEMLRRIVDQGSIDNRSNDIPQNVIMRKAQRMGIHAIEHAAYEAKNANISNLIWCLGAGQGKSLVTLRQAFGDVIINDSGDPYPGVEKWQPYEFGHQYYVRANTKTSYQGHAFELVALQQQDGDFAYGVVDRTSTGKWGVREGIFTNKNVYDHEHLLGLSVGQLDNNSDPVPSWEFVIRFPLNNPARIPQEILPGQNITVHYEGWAYGMLEYDEVAGTWTPVGEYTYLSYPGTADPTAIERAKRVVKFQDRWKDGGYSATVTLGKTRYQQHDDHVHLAHMLDVTHHHRGHSHDAVRHFLNGVPYYFSKNPLARENQKAKTWELDPEAIVVADVPNANFFSNHTRVKFRCYIPGGENMLDVWFAKPVDGHLKTPDTTGDVPYGLFRIAMHQTGWKTGFYMHDAHGLHWRGSRPHKHKFPLHPGWYEFILEFSGHTYTARLASIDHDHPDKVMSPWVAGVWWDKAIKDKHLFEGFGSWGLQAHGQVPDLIFVSHIHAHPHHHHQRSVASGSPAGGKRTVVVHDVRDAGDSGGGQMQVTVDQESDTSQITHVIGPEGQVHQKQAHFHGPYAPTRSVVASVSGGGSGPYTVLLRGSINDPLTKGGLYPGLLVQGSGGLVVRVASLLYGDDPTNPTSQHKNGKFIVGFLTDAGSPDGASFAPGLGLVWDVLEHETGLGHRRTGLYARWVDKDGIHREGWSSMDIASDAEGNQQFGFVVHPDGSTSINSFPAHDPQGQTNAMQQLGIGGSALAKKLEHEGTVLFDAGEYDSSTQRGYSYLDVSWPPDDIITPDDDQFYSTTDAPDSTDPVVWCYKTRDGANGDADALLALSCNYGGQTVLWQDTQILEVDGTQRRYKVLHDMSFAFPVYIDPTNAPNTVPMTFGNTAHLAEDVESGLSQLPIDMDVSAMHVHNGDQWVLGIGTTAHEVVTANGTVPGAITLSAPLNYSHKKGELIYLHSSNGQIVHSGGQMDALLEADSRTSDVIDGIGMGFYARDFDGQYSWYRCWWSNSPSWLPPYLHDVTLPSGSLVNSGKFMGPIGALPGQWFALACKASELGLFNLNQPPVTIEGVEMGVYSKAGGGVTVYFDAHEHGHLATKKKQPAASTGPTQVGPAAVGDPHTHPTIMGNQHHDGIHYWIEDLTGFGDWRLYWETGAVHFHDGQVFPVYGTDEEAPVGGVLALIPNQTIPAGNYIVFNCGNTDIHVHDPALEGTGLNPITIPAYSPGSAGGTQATGFGVISSQFKWTKKKGGGQKHRGPSRHLLRLGKVETNKEPATGSYPTTGGSHLKHYAELLRQNGVPRSKMHRHTPGRHHWYNTGHEVTVTTGSAPNWLAGVSVYTKDSSQDGYILADDGTRVATFPHPFSIALSNVPAGKRVVYNAGDTVTVGGRTVASNTFNWIDATVNMASKSCHDLFEVGVLAAKPDSKNGKLHFMGHHAHATKMAGDHVYSDSIASTHQTYGDSIGWMSLGTWELAGSSGGGTVYVSEPIELTLDLPVNVDLLHTGTWAFGFDTDLFSSVPAISGIHHGAVPIRIGNTAYDPDKIPLNNMIHLETSALIQGILVNHVQKNVPANQMAVKMQAVNQDVNRQTLKLFVRWYGHRL